MADVSYRPLIEDMVWSYSRIKCFSDCKYRWFLKYIRKVKPGDRYYASFGSFAHRLLERYYTGKLSKRELLFEFLSNLSTEVKGERPKPATVEKYVSGTSDYFRNFKDFEMNTLAVEKEFHFDVGGNKFVGFIDYLGERDGEIYLIDNKSRDLKPRSGKPKPTLNDREIDDMLRQLYLYSAAVKKEYGRFPSYLCFNCFRTGVFIKEKFDPHAYLEAVKWAEDMIEEIKDEEIFRTEPNVFSCRWICDVSDECEEYTESLNERRRYY